MISYQKSKFYNLKTILLGFVQITKLFDLNILEQNFQIHQTE